ncbi:glycoside hydrolase family 99-like domain-containing protein [Pseudomonas viridiflava]|uniref:glycoside hydrolase family 99-like domain-containing protein n=1 Tax=Pseudomonas viridiflava TaxID=33069 RepID=UPI001C31D466|nr:glycoside hydrolase family 99-like domain-containing protein [Pseudomonas viridiflava]QXG48517.1 glycoside hydrolase family 99-like domain-containing protein [Pseudomonas viridiflava]
MHPSAMNLGHRFLSCYLSAGQGTKVVDIGSQNINGSLHDVCPEGVEYIGVDFVAGAGVDIVLDDPYQLPFDDESLDVVVCSSVFEHSQFFWVLFLEIMRVLKPEGLLYVNAPSNGYIHRYPIDAWRFYPDAGVSLVSWAEKNGYSPALLESFVAGKSEGSIESDPASAWNDYVGVFVKDSALRFLHQARILDTYHNYSNAICDNPLIDPKPSDLTEDFTEIMDRGRFLVECQEKLADLQTLSALHSEQALDSKKAFDDIRSALDIRVEENNQLKILLDKITAESDSRSQQIVGLQTTVANMKTMIAEGESKIIQLHNLADEMLLKQNVDLVAIQRSTSWRITAPLRWVGNKAGPLRRVSLRVRSALQARGGVLGAAGNVVRLYRRDGMAGVIKRASGLKNTAVYSPAPNSGADRSNIPVIQFDPVVDAYTEYKINSPIDAKIKAIAFYLPQFHPFAENDEWWGKGFTEWTNVAKATPNYLGHYQPHLPIHSGYYDLRVPQVMEEQAKLAKEYGLYGFNYYFYWFAGKILMDTPLEMMLSNPKVDIPFCLTWANENWSRRWDGQENDILIAQDHSVEDSLAFIQHLIKYFKDDRYITVDGKPVLIIYRASIIPDMAATAKLWREEVIKHSIPGLYLVCAQTFGIRSPDEFGFDASLEFPPHTTLSHLINDQLQITNPNYNGNVFSYDQVVGNAVKLIEPDYKLFRTAMLSWDNTARKQNNSHTFHGFSLLRYKQWLSSICNNVFCNDKYSSDEKLVFVNAWNEWAEGTHLEPDRKFGYGYLQATYDVVSNYDSECIVPLTQGSYTKRNPVAAIVHVHYSEVWQSIEPYLSNLDETGCDFYFTVTESSLITLIRNRFPDAVVCLVENRGRDVLPFIKLLSNIKDLSYDMVCKVHGKKSAYRQDGDVIRDELVASLVGSQDVISKIKSMFQSDSSLGLIAPEKYLLEHTDHNLTYNHQDIQSASEILGLDFQRGVFPAGSMFWFRPEALYSLLSITSDRFDVEQGLSDGTLPHAIERLFCVVVQKNGYTVAVC